MKSTVVKLVLFCVGLAVVPFVQSLECTDIRAYNYLIEFMHTNKCESVDLVFKYLHDMTEQKGNGDCRIDIINKLANLFGAHAHTPDHCQCSGTFQLQNYSRSSNDGILSDLADTCLRNQAAYRELYNQFFTSQAHPQGLHCRTHHSLWTQLRDIGDSQCQKDIVYHISYAFSQHVDPCTCSEKYVATTSQPNQHGQTDHCYQYASYRELDNLLHNSKCMSANTVWHLLDDLQVRDSTCRKNIQNHLTHLYHNVSTNGNNDCVCTPKHQLANNDHIHLLANGSLNICSQENGSTYSAIVRDLFTHITDHGCRNHNYLWPTLAGVKDHCEGHNCHLVHIDCTTDLIVRAAMDYPSQESDSCVCASPNPASSSTKRTTTTTSTTQQTTTPATTTKLSDVTTSSHAQTVVSSPSSLHQCNHTCTMHAVLLSLPVESNKADNCSSFRTTGSASNEALPMKCCNMGDHHSWNKGAQVQQTGVCRKDEIPKYSPVSLYNGTFITDNHAGVYVGCIKEGASGFLMIFQDCTTLPRLKYVNGSDGTDPNNYFVIF